MKWIEFGFCESAPTFGWSICIYVRSCDSINYVLQCNLLYRFWAAGILTPGWHLSVKAL